MLGPRGHHDGAHSVDVAHERGDIEARTAQRRDHLRGHFHELVGDLTEQRAVDLGQVAPEHGIGPHGAVDVGDDFGFGLFFRHVLHAAGHVFARLAIGDDALIEVGADLRAQARAQLGVALLERVQRFVAGDGQLGIAHAFGEIGNSLVRDALEVAVVTDEIDVDAKRLANFARQREVRVRRRAQRAHGRHVVARQFAVQRFGGFFGRQQVGARQLGGRVRAGVDAGRYLG